jgi:hypothetical protein
MSSKQVVFRKVSGILARKILDSAGNVGEFTSITVGTDGLGLVSYYDDTNGDLKAAHCATPFCVPFWRRR